MFLFFEFSKGILGFLIFESSHDCHFSFREPFCLAISSTVATTNTTTLVDHFPVAEQVFWKTYTVNKTSWTPVLFFPSRREKPQPCLLPSLAKGQVSSLLFFPNLLLLKKKITNKNEVNKKPKTQKKKQNKKKRPPIIPPSQHATKGHLLAL